MTSLLHLKLRHTSVLVCRPLCVLPGRSDWTQWCGCGCVPATPFDADTGILFLQCQRRQPKHTARNLNPRAATSACVCLCAPDISITLY